MQQIIRPPYTITAETQEQLLDHLLYITGTTREKYAARMGVTPDDLTPPPQWAIEHLSDLLEVDLVHLGYVAKDARHEGVFGEYDAAVADLKALQNDRQDTQQPVEINKEYILSSTRTLKVSILTHIMETIRGYMENLPPVE